MIADSVTKTPTTRLRTAIGWSLIQHWGGRAISFLVFFILARLLSPVDFGLVALAAIVTGFTEIFIDQGFSDAIVQSEDDSAMFLSTAFWVNIATATLLGIAVVLSAHQIADAFAAPKLVPIIRVLSGTFFCTALSSVQVALLRRRMHYRTLAFRTTLANLISGVAACTMAIAGFGVWSLVVQQAVYSVVSTIVAWNAVGFRPSFASNAACFRELMHFGLKVCAVRTLDFLQTKLIDGLVGLYLGAVVLGIYSVGTRFSVVLIQLLGASIAEVALSHFSQLRRSQSSFSTHYLELVKKFSLILVPVFAFLMINARILVDLLFGMKWDSAAPVFAGFCAAGAFQVLIYFNNSAMTAMGRPGLQLVLNILRLALYSCAFYLVKSHGIGAIAWAMAAITIAVIAPISLFIVARLLALEYAAIIRRLYSPYVCALASTALTWFVLRHLSQHPALALVYSFLLFFGSFAMSCILLDAEAKELARPLLEFARIVRAE